MNDAVVNTATSIDMLVGGRIRDVREARGITQPEFSRRMRELVGTGWSRQVVWQAERGQKSCSAADVIAAAQVLSCTIADLASTDQQVTLGGSQTLRTDAIVSGPSAQPEVEGWARFVEAGEALNDIRNAWERYSHAIEVVRERVTSSDALRQRISDALDNAHAHMLGELTEAFSSRTPPGFDIDEYARENATPAMQVAADALSDYPIPYTQWRPQWRGRMRESKRR